jgi:hypothetical protein
MRAIRRSASANAARCVPSRAATAHATTRTQSDFLKTKTVVVEFGCTGGSLQYAAFPRGAASAHGGTCKHVRKFLRICLKDVA